MAFLRWLNKSKQVVDPETADWHIENFLWLMREFDGADAFNEAALVLPSVKFFKSSGKTGNALACEIFEQVKAYCGMADWPVTLVADDNPLAKNQPGLMYQPAAQKYALGTFSVDQGEIEISYSTNLLAKPEQLVATFAHELAHYLLAAAKTEPICTADEMEFLTDLTAVYLGFGVFLANSRFDFDQFGDTYQQGWQMQRSGYLPEADLIFGLALFLHFKKLGAEDARKFLKPHLGKLLDRAAEQVATCKSHMEGLSNTFDGN